MSDLPEREEYLADGVHISFDGWQIRLRTARPIGPGDNVIFLEPEVYGALRRYLDRFPRVKAHMEGG